MAVRYYCDWCGKEQAEIQLRKFGFQYDEMTYFHSVGGTYPTEVSKLLELCGECALEVVKVLDRVGKIRKGEPIDDDPVQPEAP